MDSICSQTYQDLEILAIDDGSMDSSANILMQYAAQDPRIRVIQQENHGISKTRNIGIDQSNGEWIAFVDSDDWLEHDALERAMAVAAEDQADIVMWSYFREYPAGPKPLNVFGEKRQRYISNPMLYPYRRMVGPVEWELSEPHKINSCVTAWGKLYRKSVIGHHRMVDTTYIGSEDTLFNIEVFSDARVVSYLPEQLYHYRKENAQSITKQNCVTIFDKACALYAEIRLRIGNCEELQIALQNRISLELIGLGMRFSRNRGVNIWMKCRMLKEVLGRPDYEYALAQLKVRYLPFPWRCFFICARHRMAFCFYIMLRSIDCLRKRG